MDTKIAAGNFDYLEKMQEFCNGPIAAEKYHMSPEIATEKIKGLAKHYYFLVKLDFIKCNKVK